MFSFKTGPVFLRGVRTSLVDRGTAGWMVARCFGRWCDSLAKIQKRMMRYESTAFPATASSFEAFPHIMALARNGCKALPMSHTSPLLDRISRNMLNRKRPTSWLVGLCLCPNVQYLFKKKLLAAPAI